MLKTGVENFVKICSHKKTISRAIFSSRRASRVGSRTVNNCYFSLKSWTKSIAKSLDPRLKRNQSSLSTLHGYRFHYWANTRDFLPFGLCSFSPGNLAKQTLSIFQVHIYIFKAGRNRGYYTLLHTPDSYSFLCRQSLAFSLLSIPFLFPLQIYNELISNPRRKDLLNKPVVKKIDEKWGTRRKVSILEYKKSCQILSPSFYWGNLEKTSVLKRRWWLWWWWA